MKYTLCTIAERNRSSFTLYTDVVHVDRARETEREEKYVRIDFNENLSRQEKVLDNENNIL